MSDRPAGPPALVIGHRDFAAGIVSAVTAITGREDLFRTASNYGLDARGVETLVREAIADGVTVIFSDLPAGSTTMAARRAQRDFPGITVVTGVNLPVLLDYAFAASDAADAADAAVVKGRAAMIVARGIRSAD
jgi:mannose/fructose-specific phosphotransferase system component IIA